MSNLKRDVTALHPEQRELISIFEKIAYRHSYYDTFRTLVDFILHEYTAGSEPFLSKDYVFPSDFEGSEIEGFKKMLQEILKLCHQECRLWTGVSGWYDPLGVLFENVSSNFTKQAAGQFFTPPSLCNLTAQITIPPPSSENIGKTLLEPCSGSGRMVLAANNINPSLYCVANDIDPICAKMTAVNMCLNGAIGEVTCNDGLYSIEKNYRFGFKVVPLMYLYPDNILINTVTQFKKQFCLLPMPFKESMIKMIEPTQKEAAEKLIMSQVEFRKELHPQGMQGILFEAEKLKKKKPITINKPKKAVQTVEEKFSLLFNL
jgi:type I restriction enzyme M protein